MKTFPPFILAVALLLVAAGIAGARLVQSWSYQKMFDSSDLVVIAKPVWTQDMAEEAILPNLAPDVHVVGSSTEFEVGAVMKGDKSAKKILLHHYRLADPKALMMNGPILVTFNPAEGKSWLLFLKKEADGRFAPITGQTDPGLCAILPADEIDLVVIGKPVSAKKPVTGDETTMAGVSPPENLAGYQTEFAVQEVLEGDKAAKKFALHHYERTRIPIDFKPEPDGLYLMFLKKEADGRFGPPGRGGGETMADGFPVIKLESALK